MHSISREYWFSAAHRLEGHPKCGRLHGHNYRVVVFVSCEELDDNGMVIDYGELDKIVKPLIDECYDHMYLVSNANEDAGDPYADLAGELGHAYYLRMPTSTAENIAERLLKELRSLRVPGIDFYKVQVDETPKSSAAYGV